MVAKQHGPRDLFAIALVKQELIAFEPQSLKRHMFVNGPVGSRSSSFQQQPFHRLLQGAVAAAALSVRYG
eukprot:1108372-Amphidinium_carterae.2